MALTYQPVLVSIDLAVAEALPPEVFRSIPKGHNAALIDPDGGLERAPP